MRYTQYKKRVQILNILLHPPGKLKGCPGFMAVNKPSSRAKPEDRFYLCLPPQALYTVFQCRFSACNIEKLGIGPGDEATSLHVLISH